MSNRATTGTAIARAIILGELTMAIEIDEVLVTLVEPHMYNEHDAVAKINGYLVAVIDGGLLLGQQKMVMIETAGRNSATATLLEALSS